MNVVLTLVISIVSFIPLYFLRHVLGGMVGLYRVVPVNEAHIRVLRNSKTTFSAREGRSAYWFIPFITRVHRLPLSNLSVPVNDIKLNDKNMAKFICDIACFINIKNIDLAVERLVLTRATEEELGFDFTKLSDDLRAIMESVGRTVTTKQTLLDIYMNRQMLDNAITKEVEAVFPKWGIELVDLELKDIKDATGSTIIHDIERKVASEIRRDAEIRVAETTKEAELAKAQAEEIYRKRQIEKDKFIGMAEQQKNLEIAEKEAEANIKKIEAMRKLEVGKAEIDKQKIEQAAMAQRIKYTVEAEGHSNEIQTVGKAEADVIRIKKEAEAAGTLKLAQALKEFDQVAINVKALDIHRDVMLNKFNTLAHAVEKADIKWIMSGANAQKFFGINLDAEGGANIQQFFHESGIDLEQLKSLVKKEKDDHAKSK